MKKHRFLVSDESLNDHGFKLLTSGIDLTQFERNPIMLYMHERPTIIGRWENLSVESDKLYADAVFDMDDPKAKEIAGKVERGFLKSASVGIKFNPDDRAGDTIKKCKLYEISIVDVGSNQNALRLYNDEELAELSLIQLTATNTATNLLKLYQTPEHSQILKLVQNLNSENIKLKAQIEKVENHQEEEAHELLELLSERKKLDPVTKELYTKLFKEDFKKGKATVMSLLNLKTLSLLELVEQRKITNSGKDTSTKAKAEWDLEDYRLYAPKELENNPVLFQQLVDNQFKK
ncbi:HK97 family phage prohead protease [Leeuwenhoekiella parthenopeia]|uniref:HK97 family phage prohead protease n=1 Tax=Leeuwenhoekiella parthenopeia TaxID=2890320 RepID=A0ABS8GT22_9FLAO|nr:HK97 family phage prohead protease [Leeuwenhoekiella parthenopeia]MCC4211703.1 HK97 family phage prohead protease [Leeuwenhoekiella parthenopeia]